MNISFRLLRPYLCKDLLPLRTAGCTLRGQFYSVGRVASLTDSVKNLRQTDIQQRIRELRDARADTYPSITADARSVTCRDFRQRYATLKPGESREDESVTLRGISNCLSYHMGMT